MIQETIAVETSTKKHPSEKIFAILDKLPIDEAIEAYHSAGKLLHTKIETERERVNNQLEKLNGK